MSPDSKILWTSWLIGNTECLCYMSGSQNTMASAYGKMDDCRIPDLVYGHGLIEVQCHAGDRKNPWELGLKSESGCVKTKLGVEWPYPSIQIILNWWLCNHGASDNHLRSHA